jgi:hypothetical protein
MIPCVYLAVVVLVMHGNGDLTATVTVVVDGHHPAVDVVLLVRLGVRIVLVAFARAGRCRIDDQGDRSSQKQAHYSSEKTFHD